MWLATITRPDVATAVRNDAALAQSLREALECGVEFFCVSECDSGVGDSLCAWFSFGSKIVG